MDNEFLGKVFDIVKEELDDSEPLIRFKHPEELKNLLSLPLGAATTDQQLETFVRQVLRYSVKTNRPTFRNQLYGAVDPYGLAGAWIAEAFNTSQYTFEVAPAFTLIEQEVLRRALERFGLSGGDGVFSPGGSVSLMYALCAARHAAFPRVKAEGMRALPACIVFTSAESHYSVKKAAHWLGFGTDALSFIPTDAHGRMRTADLEAAVRSALQTGRHPLMVNATAGTTVLGAVDDLNAVADVCQKYGIWMHVDACWGGSLIFSETHRSKLAGIERADSVSWNPHKMLGAPLQCAVILTRRAGALLAANCAAAEYLFQQDKFYDVAYDTGDKSVQCGRKIDAFKLWVMWKARGNAGLGGLVDRTMAAAAACLAAAAARPGFRLVSDRLQCPNVCFWYIPQFMRERREDEAWWDIMHKITPKIKELLTLSSALMVAYCPLPPRRNFLRLALTCHPAPCERAVQEMLQAIEGCGEMVREDML